MSKILIPVILNNSSLQSYINEISSGFIEDRFNLKCYQTPQYIDEKSEYIITDEKYLSDIEKKFKNLKKIFLFNYSNKKVSLTNSKAELIIFDLPFKFSDIISAINNTILHSRAYEEKLIKFNNFVYDPRLRKLYDKVLSIRFTEKEAQIFQYLLQNKNTNIRKKKLLNEVWKYDESIDTHTLETHIYSIRKKIDTKLKIRNLIVFEEDRGYSINLSLL